MADYIDSFVDTREKRGLLMRLLCWFGWMIVCALALYTASRLIMVNDYAGLFGYIGEKGTVQNLTLDSSTITGSNNVGAVAGTNDGAIDNCHVTGSVNITVGGTAVGGVVGWNTGTVTGCSSSASVPLSHNAGGVVGINESSGKVIACYSTGTVTDTGSSRVGGVVGSNLGIVTACYATGDVTSTSDTAGGVAGYNYDSGTVDVCYWSGSQTQGIGENDGTGDATKVDGNAIKWIEKVGETPSAMDAMNKELEGEGWQYIPGSDSPLALKKN